MGSSSRTPCGVRGLKADRHTEWRRETRRTPCGVRGLKVPDNPDDAVGDKSHSVWGAWIESAGIRGKSYRGEVALRVGCVD